MGEAADEPLECPVGAGEIGRCVSGRGQEEVQCLKYLWEHRSLERTGATPLPVDCGQCAVDFRAFRGELVQEVLAQELFGGSAAAQVVNAGDVASAVEGFEEVLRRWHAGQQVRDVGNAAGDFLGDIRGRHADTEPSLFLEQDIEHKPVVESPVTGQVTDDGHAVGEAVNCGHIPGRTRGLAPAPAGPAPDGQVGLLALGACW